MNNLAMLQLLKQTLSYTVIAVCIITIPTLIVGLFISVIQAATQVNEATMTFIPKLIVMFIIISMVGPWLMHELIVFTQHMLLNIKEFIR